ncbi:MAG TPA: PepSY domain-containing protein, partial [Rhizomicrobium sp.]|nr:PepSY domain-containing protein [Rhizomicrobium sp.]
MAMTQQTIKRWYLVHKWTSLISTVFLLMLCITGLPLIFHDEIDAAMGGPKPAATVPLGAKVDLDRVVATALKDHPGHVVTFLGWDLNEPIVAAFTAPSHTAPPDALNTDMFDARTGEKLTRKAGYDSVSDFLLELHEAMFAGLPGTLFLGGMGLLLVAALVSGVVVYVPFMRKLRFATVRKDRSTRLKWLDLHNVIGIVTLAWLMVVGVTGVINTLSVPAAALWQGSELVDMLKPYRALPPPKRLASVNLVLANALKTSPGMSPASLAFPGTAFASPRHFTVFLRGSTPVTRRLIAPRLVDAATGEVVAMRDMPLYVKTLFLSQPLHFGDYAGLPLSVPWRRRGLRN